CLQYSSGPFTF
nr:immunoglobulin light chain junction region [Macaca mulatta]